MTDLSPEAQRAADMFFTMVREMEQQHAICVNKAGLLGNVVAGREQVSFAVIDRCREAALQLTQASHVFKTIFNKCIGNELADSKDFADRLEINRVLVGTALDDIKTIISWVPTAANTRRDAT